MIVIGVTGSIGMGKSALTRQFARCGAATFDADRIVHALLAPGGPAASAVAAQFPQALVAGAIDRRRLGADIFANRARRRTLEAILHPLVRRAQRRFLAAQKAKGRAFAVLDIPLLYETGGSTLCDCVVVATAPAWVQRRRALARPLMTPAHLRQILSAQMPDAKKRRRADFVVMTGPGKNATLRAVRSILRSLRRKNPCRRARTR